jgi:hypothetical protein
MTMVSFLYCWGIKKSNSPTELESVWRLSPFNPIVAYISGSSVSLSSNLPEMARVFWASAFEALRKNKAQIIILKTKPTTIFKQRWPS